MRCEIFSIRIVFIWATWSSLYICALIKSNIQTQNNIAIENLKENVENEYIDGQLTTQLELMWHISNSSLKAHKEYNLLHYSELPELKPPRVG